MTTEIKTAYLSPAKATLEMSVTRTPQPSASIVLDLGIPRFTVFSVKFPIPSNEETFPQVASEALAVMLDEMTAFMISTNYDKSTIAKVYALALSCYKGMESTKQQGDKGGSMVESARGEFDIPPEFINETQRQVVTASSEKVHRSPKYRRLEFVPARPTEPSKNDVLRAIKRYRFQNIKTQPYPLYIVVYDNMGKPKGTLSLGPGFHNELLKMQYGKKATAKSFEDVLDGLGWKKGAKRYEHPDHPNYGVAIGTGTATLWSPGDWQDNCHDHALESESGETFPSPENLEDYLKAFASDGPRGKTAGFEKTALNIPRLVKDFGQALTDRYRLDFPASSIGYTPENIIDQIIIPFDPTGNHEYTAWMTGNYARGELGKFQDFADAVAPLIKRFHVLKITKNLELQDRDINKVGGLAGLQKLLYRYADVEALSKREKSMTQEQRFYHSKAATLVHNDAEVKVVIPHTEEAAKFFGINTKWCTSAENNNRFAQYNAVGPLYIVLIKKENARFQFHFQSSLFTDELDHSLDIYEWLVSHPKVAILFKPIVEEVAENEPSECETCGGRGFESCPNCSEGNIECEECDGSGTVKCENCDNEKFISCPECSGEGIFECKTCRGGGKSDVVCSTCDGTGEGVLGAKGRRRNCPDCGGSGTERKTCDNCEGTGRVPDPGILRGTECPYCTGTGEVKLEKKCPGCGGSGKVDCPYCNGKGDQQCPACDGKGDQQCTACDGNGSTYCDNCEDGKVECDNCSGTGKSPELFNFLQGCRKATAGPSLPQKIRNLFQASKKADYYDEQGYWAGSGGGASGILPICTVTGRICFAWRSPEVQEGSCWGTLGGAVKRGHVGGRERQGGDWRRRPGTGDNPFLSRLCFHGINQLSLSKNDLSREEWLIWVKRLYERQDLSKGIPVASSTIIS